MIDLHTHVLPAAGDGASTWKEAEIMCRLAARDGIRRLAATPEFFRGDRESDTSALKKDVGVLRRRLKTAGTGRLEILFGASCMFHDEIVSKVSDGRVPTLGESRYFLLDLPVELPSDLEDQIFEICLAGAVPIICGPERNPTLAEKPGVLHGLLRSGAYAHVTAGSLTGAFGSKTERAAEEMVRCRLVQMIASDARDADDRPPVLSGARKAAADLLGAELADQMVNDVPAAVLADEPIPFPEPISPKGRRWRRIRILLGR